MIASPSGRRRRLRGAPAITITNVEIIMRLKTGLIGLAAALLLGGVANAGRLLRVLVVEASDVGAYVKALEDGKALLKKTGSPAELHVWLARYAGRMPGAWWCRSSTRA